MNRKTDRRKVQRYISHNFRKTRIRKGRWEKGKINRNNNSDKWRLGAVILRSVSCLGRQVVRISEQNEERGKE